jgi:hypothetical protein
MHDSPTGRTKGRTLARALSMLACVAAFGCGASKPQATSRATPPREAPGYREAKAIGFRAPDDGVVPLCMHFQGGAKPAAENFMRSSQRGVPIAREAHVGSFHCYEFAEATAGVHVDLLYFVPEMSTRQQVVGVPPGAFLRGVRSGAGDGAPPSAQEGNSVQPEHFLVR